MVPNYSYALSQARSKIEIAVKMKDITDLFDELRDITASLIFMSGVL